MKLNWPLILVTIIVFKLVEVSLAETLPSSYALAYPGTYLTSTSCELPTLTTYLKIEQ